MATSFFKWPGSKSWISNLFSNINFSFDRIIEPFCGSCSFYFTRTEKHAILSDINTNLILTLEGVKRNPEIVINYLKTLSNTQDNYNILKNADLSGNIPAIAAKMIFLTNTSWGGMYRENLKGEFNVPFGNNNRLHYNEFKILDASRKLRFAKILNQDFRQTILQSSKNDLLFVDPPYLNGANGIVFAKYGALVFSNSDYIDLINMIIDLGNRNYHIIFCNSLANLERNSLFGWHCIELQKRNSMRAYRDHTSRVEYFYISPALQLIIRNQ